MPTAFAAAFILFWGWPYLLGLAAGLTMSIVAGVVVEFALDPPLPPLAAPRRDRRDARHHPADGRASASSIPRWWGRNLASERIAPPRRLEADHRAGHPQRQRPHRVDRRAADRSPALRGSSRAAGIGLAIRASAERGDRAAMLGIPVGRLNTVVWAIAAAAVVRRAVPAQRDHRRARSGTRSGFPALLQALAALVIGQARATADDRRDGRCRARLARVRASMELRVARRRLSDHGGGHVRRAARATDQPVAARQRCRQHVARRRGSAAADGGGASPSEGASRAVDRSSRSAIAVVLGARRARRRLHVIKASAHLRVRRSSGCRWWCSPVGPDRSRSARWASSGSAPPSAPRARRAGTST